MTKWYSHGDRRRWVYNESCSVCSAVLKRHDYERLTYWDDVSWVAGSPHNWYLQDFLWYTPNAAYACRCTSCGGRARRSGRPQGPGPATPFVVVQL